MAGQGAFIFGCAGPRLTSAEARFFAKVDPWGFILFARNVETPDQLRALTAALRDAVGRDAPIFIDQEGGRVARLRPPHWRDWPPPLDHVAGLSDDDAEQVLWLRYRVICDELLSLGIDGNCAPLADVAVPETHPFLRNRCYGTDPVSVAGRARAVADAHRAGGVLPVLKHIPGHGRGTVDSHLGLPVVTEDRAALDQDFAPFRAVADLPLAMTAHVTYTALDDLPATQSPEVIRLIREDLGFAGLLMTDDISMEALGGDLVTRSEVSLAAGCDLVLHCNGRLDEMTQIAGLGPMTPAAQGRADRALTARMAPDPFDATAALGALAALMGERSDA